MARKGPDYAAPVRRILVSLLVLVLLAVFLFWQIDSPRAERMRAAFIDRFVPSFEWVMAPVTWASGVLGVAAGAAAEVAAGPTTGLTPFALLAGLPM